MNMTSASCPAALSFIFKPCPHTDPLRAGSIGVGCTIDRTVTVTIRRLVEAHHDAPRRNRIIFNGEPISFPTVDYIIKKITDEPFTVSIESSLPLGYGFGISGASALATAYALNQHEETHDSTALQEIAHTAEIINKTGLGTVATQITGGFLIKKTPGLPVKATRFPFEDHPLYLTMLGTMETPDILSNDSLMETVCNAADQALARIQQTTHPSLAQIVDISYDYIKTSGLPISKRTQEIIETIRYAGGAATMAILGQTVISTQPPPETGALRIEKIYCARRTVEKN